MLITCLGSYLHAMQDLMRHWLRVLHTADLRACYPVSAPVPACHMNDFIQTFDMPLLFLCLGYLRFNAHFRLQKSALCYCLSHTPSFDHHSPTATTDLGLRAYRAHSVVQPPRKIFVFHLGTIFSNSKRRSFDWYVSLRSRLHGEYGASKPRPPIGECSLD